MTKDMDKLTIGIILATLTMEEIDKGSPRWYERRRGGQSHGWKVLHYIAARYDLPRQVVIDIVNGFLRAIV